MTWEVKPLIDANTGQHFTAAVWVGGGIPPTILVPFAINAPQDPNPQTVLSGVTAAITFPAPTPTGIPILITGLPFISKKVVCAWSCQRQNAMVAGGGEYIFTDNAAPFGGGIESDGNARQAYSMIVTVDLFPGVHIIGVSCTCTAGVGDAETFSEGVLTLQVYP